MSDLEPSPIFKMAENRPLDITQDVPSEIMTKIFTSIYQGDVLVPSYNGYPWIIGHVCARWRQILWDTPSIWNKITIGQPGREIGESADVVDILRYILSKIPGPISFCDLQHGYIRANNVSDVIFRNFARFTNLELTGLDQDQLSSIFVLPSSALVQLESLTLRRLSIDKDFPEYNTSSLQFAPNLHSVLYDISSPKYIPSLFLLPWTRIRHFEALGMYTPPDMIYHIFKSSPLLQSFHCLVDSGKEISHVSNISVPALKELFLRTADIFDWDGFLNPITISSLESLTLLSPQIPCAPIKSLISRSCCPLLHLECSMATPHEDDSDVDIEFTLENLPSLTYLAIPWSIPPSIFAKIYSGLFPKLKKANIFVRPDGFGAFLDMLESYINIPCKRDCTFIIKSREGPGLLEQGNRYLANCSAYDSVEGLNITIFDLGYSAVRPIGM